jgi:dephospho-CoA kinase
MKMPKIIGLTGGIGSGKTTISSYFATFGIPVYIADNEAKKITNEPEIIFKIKEIFGSEIFENNILDRKKLAAIVFDDKSKLEQLNKIIHPAVQKHFENWLENHSESKFIIKESAILFETGGYKKCDYIITVVVPLEERIKRIMLRDKCSKDDVNKRIQNQWSDEQKSEKSDFVIQNSNLKIAKSQVDKILKILSNQ